MLEEWFQESWHAQLLSLLYRSQKEVLGEHHTAEALPSEVQLCLQLPDWIHQLYSDECDNMGITSDATCTSPLFSTSIRSSISSFDLNSKFAHAPCSLQTPRMWFDWGSYWSLLLTFNSSRITIWCLMSCFFTKGSTKAKDNFMFFSDVGKEGSIWRCNNGWDDYSLACRIKQW